GPELGVGIDESRKTGMIRIACHDYALLRAEHHNVTSSMPVPGKFEAQITVLLPDYIRFVERYRWQCGFKSLHLTRKQLQLCNTLQEWPLLRFRRRFAQTPAQVFELMHYLLRSARAGACGVKGSLQPRYQ